MAVIPEPRDQRAAALSMFADTEHPLSAAEDTVMKRHVGVGSVWQALASSALFPALMAALPFLLVAIWLQGLHVQINTFHFNDETIYHLGVIRKFAAELPLPDLRDYDSATTPLFHLLMAVPTRLWDAGLPTLRALNVLLSWGVVLGLYGLFHRRLGLTRRDAGWAAAAMGMSPYFFGASFLALTDNLAWGLAVLAMAQALNCDAKSSLRQWCVFAGLVGLVLLARQNYVWLFVAGALLAMTSEGNGPTRALRTAVMLASALPLLPLIMVWHGLVPPTFQHGGQSGVEHTPLGSLNLVALNYLLAVIGCYGLLFPGHPPAWRGLPAFAG